MFLTVILESFFSHLVGSFDFLWFSGRKYLFSWPSMEAKWSVEQEQNSIFLWHLKWVWEWRSDMKGSWSSNRQHHSPVISLSLIQLTSNKEKITTLLYLFYLCIYNNKAHFSNIIAFASVIGFSAHLSSIQPLIAL